ncbi:MAG: type II toxin-antitoxin system PemK/MazF family toxin [Methylococcus sp.]|nr:type II toxin-antitoxin system PemK/MazF family toxin [Methylococcus sp.]
MTTSGTMCKPGWIMLVPYPFSDSAQQKKHPVLALTEPDGFGDFVELAVTSKGHHAGSIALNLRAMRSGILPKQSGVRTDKVFTLNRSLIVKRIGGVSEFLFAQARLALCQKLGCQQPTHRS